MKKYLQLLFASLATIGILGCQMPEKMNAKTLKDEKLNLNPKLTKPVIKKVWVPESIEDDGRVLVEGHYKWLLEKNSTWSR